MRDLTVREGSLVDRALRGPVLATTTDRGRAERSRLTWGSYDDSGVYCLRPLGVLNGLVGLRLQMVDVCPRRQCHGRVPHSALAHWLGWVRR